jgi:uncharacterized protein (TIGR00162 family)
MEFYLKETQKPKLKKPILVEGLPGIGYVGRIAAKHLVSELGAEKFAILHSHHFQPQVIIKKSGMIQTMKNEFYFWKAQNNTQRDLIIIVGNTQSMSPEGQYALSEKLLDIVEPYEIDTIYTLGGLGMGQMVEKPKVLGAVTHKKLIPALEELGVIVRRDEIGQIIGVSGLLLALSSLRGIHGACLMGETSGFYMDPLSAKAVLEVLSTLLNVEVDVKKLAKRAKAAEKRVAEAQKVEKKIMEDMGIIQKGEPTADDMRYIG